MKRPRRRLVLLLVLLAVASTVLISLLLRPTQPTMPYDPGTSERTTPVYDPPVLAGQMAWTVVLCAGGVYARTADTIVLTSSDHCAAEGTIATDPSGVGVAGVWGPTAREATCPHEDHICEPSAMNYLIVAPDRIPWGHLNEIDMGAGGYRTVTPTTRPLDCAKINVNDPVETDGRGLYRTGKVLQKGENLKPALLDSIYFPCMIVANIKVATGDSGGIVFVRGIPSGVAARSFGGWLGFTPLESGLANLGLTMCDSPNCGLIPP